MAVGVVLDFPGGTLAQYDQVMGRMGLGPGAPLPPGGVFHWVTQTDGGLRVTDVWETREQFLAFAEEQIVPYSQEFGLPEPQIAFHEVHNHLGQA